MVVVCLFQTLHHSINRFMFYGALSTFEINVRILLRFYITSGGAMSLSTYLIQKVTSVFNSSYNSCIHYKIITKTVLFKTLLNSYQIIEYTIIKIVKLQEETYRICLSIMVTRKRICKINCWVYGYHQKKGLQENQASKIFPKKIKLLMGKLTTCLNPVSALHLIKGCNIGYLYFINILFIELLI